MEISLDLRSTKKKLFDFSDVANEKNELVPPLPSTLWLFVWKEKSTQLNFDGDKWFLMDFRNGIMQKRLFICERMSTKRCGCAAYTLRSGLWAEWLIAFICGIKMNTVAGTIMKFFLLIKREIIFCWGERVWSQERPWIGFCPKKSLEIVFDAAMDGQNNLGFLDDFDIHPKFYGHKKFGSVSIDSNDCLMGIQV